MAHRAAAPEAVTTGWKFRFEHHTITWIVGEVETIEKRASGKLAR